MSEPLITTPATFGENGNLLLERELGQGGMGGVYMGRDKMLDRAVAVKIMNREYGADAEFVEKFKKEAQAAARLIHPNIVQVYSYGIVDGMPYIAMELAGGGSLEELMRHHLGTTDIARVMKIGEQVAQALRCANDIGCVHGDVKPDNILFDSNGNAKLVDFGLAAMQKETDEIWGTPYYISPEKVRKEVIDFRADMYSLGATLYHVLTGVAPFEGKDAEAVVRARFNATPKKPSEIRPEIPEAVDNLVMRMLAFKKEDRYPTFEALLHEYSDVLATGLTPPKPKFVPHFTPSGCPTPVGGATANDNGPSDGKKRFTLKNGRRTRKAAADENDAPSPTPPAPVTPEPNVGRRVALTIGIVIASVALVGGLLAYYVFSSRSAAAAKAEAQLNRSAQTIRANIASTSDSARNCADGADKSVVEIFAACEKVVAKLARELPEIKGIGRPPMTPELLAAIASTNGDQVVEAAKTAVKTAKAKPTVASSKPAPVANSKRFRPPTEEESDPKSPEGMEYLRLKAEFEAKLAASKPAPSAADEGAAKTAEPALPEVSLDAEFKNVVEDMAALWNCAYGCQAAAIRIRGEINTILDECDAAAKLPCANENDLRALNAQYEKLSDHYKTTISSDNLKEIKKGLGFVQSRGDKLVNQTINRLRAKRNEARRQAEKAQREAERKAKEEADRKAHEELVASETAKARDTFAEIAEGKLLKQLAWSSARSQLEFLKTGFSSVEGKIAVDQEIDKIEAMERTHQIFIANIEGFQFRKSDLGKEYVRVKSADQLEMRVSKGRDANKSGKITWALLYEKYQGNLNELINCFIVDGRRNAKPPLELKDWAEAMCGAALTMQLICSENRGSETRCKELVKEVAKGYPEFGGKLKTMFPDLDIDSLSSAEDD